jgi:hypothetical protein
MDDTTKYRIDGGVMLLKNNNGAVEFVGFFDDQPEAHARIKELSQGMTMIAQDYFLVTGERLMPVEMSDEPV